MDVKWLPLVAALRARATRVRRRPPSRMRARSRSIPPMRRYASTRRARVTCRCGSSGRTCRPRREARRAEPRAARRGQPAVAPTTTWGIPDVFVAVDAARCGWTANDARIVLDDCALSPRIALAATTLAIGSAADAPAKLARAAGRARFRSATARRTASRATCTCRSPATRSTSRSSSAAIYKVTGSRRRRRGSSRTDQPFSRSPRRAATSCCEKFRPVHTGCTAWLPPRSGQSARRARQGDGRRRRPRRGHARHHEAMTWVVPVELEEAVYASGARRSSAMHRWRRAALTKAIVDRSKRYTSDRDRLAAAERSQPATSLRAPRSSRSRTR